MNQSTWLARGKELYSAHQTSQFQVGDWLRAGISAYGRERAFEAVATITPNKRNFFTRCLTVATLYPASLRFPALPFYVYESLKHFPMSFLDTFIPSIADSGLSRWQILSKAVEQFGSDPAPRRRLAKRIPIRLESALYHKLTAHAKTKNVQPQTLVAEVLESYLGAAQSAGNRAPGVAEASGNDADDSSPRPTYAERRAAQKAEKVEELKAAGKFKTKIEIAFVACKGRAADFVDTENGAVKLPKMKQRATSFRSFEDALAGAREYSEAKRYVVIPYTCPRCSNGKPVWHLRYPEEVDLSKEQAEVRATVQDFIQSTRASWRQQHVQA